MDNGGTAKEGVGRTYAGVDGFCPLASYIGAYGWPLELSLRPGTQHSAKDTEDNLKRVIPMAQRLSASGPKVPLLARLDSGFDAVALMACVELMNQPGQRQPSVQVDFLLKWNPRSTDRNEMATQLDAGQITGPGTGTGPGPGPGAVTRKHFCAGKRAALWEQRVVVNGIHRPVRRVLRLL